MTTFRQVAAAARTLRDVVATTRYDGAPVLKARGCFMAGLASHPSAEPGTLVVRVGDERDSLLEDAPDTYYLTDPYRPHPVVLVRLARLPREALRDLLSMAWRETVKKARPSRRSGQR